MATGTIIEKRHYAKRALRIFVNIAVIALSPLYILPVICYQLIKEAIESDKTHENCSRKILTGKKWFWE